MDNPGVMVTSLIQRTFIDPQSSLYFETRSRLDAIKLNCDPKKTRIPNPMHDGVVPSLDTWNAKSLKDGGNLE
jgi:hypothetical protein